MLKIINFIVEVRRENGREVIIFTGQIERKRKVEIDEIEEDTSEKVSNIDIYTFSIA